MSPTPPSPQGEGRAPYRLPMGPDRIRSLSEARTDYQPAVRRRVPHARAQVLESDPPWLHDGLTIRLRVRGTPTDLFATSVMATAINRSPETLRRLIREGIVPETRYFAPGHGRFGRKRLWTREQVLATAAVFEGAGLLGRPRRWAGADLPAILATTINFLTRSARCGVRVPVHVG